MDRHLIYLTGFMGSGKSTIAPILANTLGYSHVDIDIEIERATGKTVKEIFSELGEKYFRDVERAVLKDISGRAGCVVSLGGGTITNETNLGIVKSTGILVYLKVRPEQIFNRLRHKTDRPMLRSASEPHVGDDELRQRIHALLHQREPFYEKADLTIWTDDRRVGVTVDEIVHALQHF